MTTSTLKAFLLSSLCFSLLILLSLSLQAQLTTLTGTLNQVATAVTAIDTASNSVTVADPTGFQESDRVLLIKMQGALIDESSSANFGTINTLNGVGLYEIANVCSVLGNQVSFQHTLQNGGSYAPLGTFTGKMQMIKIPRYGGDVNVTGTLTAPAWDGTTGGVLILQSEGTLTLNGDIDMSGKGFRGGHNLNSAYLCTPTLDANNVNENSTLPYYTLASGEGACKGEGIAAYIADKEAGWGSQANGGGGGNNKNAGGGGGSNYGIGGKGGTREPAVGEPAISCRGKYEGVQGKKLDQLGYSLANNRIFLGGGGGAGHADDNQGQPGAAGGGIVILIAQEIQGGHPFNVFNIRANGADALDAGDDGGSGGGAGGAILIQAQFNSRPLNLEARGGSGGGASHLGTECNGPGGGGGGGFIWTSNPLGAQITTDVTGGQFGLTGNSSGCGSGGLVTSNSAWAGQAGAVQNNLILPEETVAYASCILQTPSLDLETIAQPGRIILRWEVTHELANDRYLIERSADGHAFELLAEQASRGASTQAVTYEWTDERPLPGTAYYRIKRINSQGATAYSAQTEATFEPVHQLRLHTFPNPVGRKETLNVQVELPQTGSLQLELRNAMGQQVQSPKVFPDLSAGKHELPLSLETLAPGPYLLSVRVGRHSNQYKILVL